MQKEKNNEAQDTLKFKIPTVNQHVNEGTKIFRMPKNQAAETKNPANRPPSPQLRKSSASGHTPSPVQNQRPVSNQRPSYNQRPTNNQHPSNNQRPINEQPPSRKPVSEVQRQQKVQYDESPYIEPPVQKKAKKKHNPFFGFIRALIAIAVVIFTLYSAIAMYYITKVTPLESTGQYENDESTLLYSSDVKNILVIGTDARDTSTRGLSDSMILISLNKKNKKIQMTSLMRDMYTQIEGYGSEKLNAAYSHGGAELLADTIEDSFKVRIDGCVTVNFSAVAYIVDAVGGVDITLSDSEAEAVNTILCSEVNEIMGDDPYSDFLAGAGTYRLNGKQALSYSRIRYVGDADFERTQRQRTVINQILSNMKSVNPLTLNKNIKRALPYIGTDLSKKDMYVLCLRLPSLLIGYDIEQYRIPAENTWWYDETEDGQSILGVDFDANTQLIRQNIYLAG